MPLFLLFSPVSPLPYAGYASRNTTRHSYIIVTPVFCNRLVDELSDVFLVGNVDVHSVGPSAVLRDGRRHDSA